MIPECENKAPQENTMLCLKLARTEQAISIQHVGPTPGVKQALKLGIKPILLIGMCLVVFGGETMGQKVSDVVRWNNGKAYLFYDTGQYIRFDIATDQS